MLTLPPPNKSGLNEGYIWMYPHGIPFQKGFMESSSWRFFVQGAPQADSWGGLHTLIHVIHLFVLKGWFLLPGMVKTL